MLRYLQRLTTGCCDRRARPGQLVCASDEDADFGRCDPVRTCLPHEFCDVGDLLRLVLYNSDRGRRTIEDGHRAGAIIAQAVDIPNDGRDQTVRDLPDLMRGAIIDLERRRPAADVDAEPLPREGLLKDALSEIAGEEQRVRPLGRNRREEAQLGDAEVLRLVDDNVGERLVAPVGEIGSNQRRAAAR